MDDWKDVCATGWNDTWSNLACFQLGTFPPIETEYREISVRNESDEETATETGPRKELFHLNATILPETVLSVQAAAANVAEDNCDMVVDLKCQEFGKKILFYTRGQFLKKIISGIA